jgi:hypothetical protein
MLRLIASDIDGTLLHGSESEISPKLFSLIHQLKEKGVLFAPASGRQYHSLRRLFAPAAAELCFLCENGAEVYAPCAREEDAYPLYHSSIPRDICQGIVEDILARPDCSALVSGPNMSYLISRHPAFVDRVEHFTRNRFQVVERYEDVPGDIIKLAAFCNEGSQQVDEALAPRWRRKGLTVSRAGQLWVDFTISSKGTGIVVLCDLLGIDPQDVMAFGDQYNDQPMLDLVGYPVIMDNAPEPLRQRYPYHCRRVEEYLEGMLAQL